MLKLREEIQLVIKSEMTDFDTKIKNEFTDWKPIHVGIAHQVFAKSFNSVITDGYSSPEYNFASDELINYLKEMNYDYFFRIYFCEKLDDNYDEVRFYLSEKNQFLKKKSLNHNKNTVYFMGNSIKTVSLHKGEKEPKYQKVHKLTADMDHYIIETSTGKLSVNKIFHTYRYDYSILKHLPINDENIINYFYNLEVKLGLRFKAKVSDKNNNEENKPSIARATTKEEYEAHLKEIKDSTICG